MTAKAVTEKDVERWLGTLSVDEVNGIIDTLTLKKKGKRFEKLDRVHKWLSGEYDASDFEATNGQTGVKAQESRWQVRQKFLVSQCQDHSGRLSHHPNVSQYDPHPLSRYLEEQVDATEENSSEVERVEDTSSTSQNETEWYRARMDHTTRNETKRAGSSNTSEEPERKATQLEVMVQAVQQLRVAFQRMEQRLDMLALAVEESRSQSNAGITKAIQTEGSRVAFQDTCTVHGTSPRSRVNRGCNQPEALRNQQRDSPSNQQVSWREGGAPNSAVPASKANAANGRDVGQAVKRWNLQFRGDSTESIDTFLCRVERRRAGANLSESDLFASLPLLLTGVANTWYNSYRDSWRSWDEFQSAARRRWGSKLDLQVRMRLEASQRYQREDELIDRVVRSEATLERKRSDRTLIPPGNSVRPEGADRPLKGRPKARKPKAAPKIAATRGAPAKEQQKEIQGDSDVLLLILKKVEALRQSSTRAQTSKSKSRGDSCDERTERARKMRSSGSDSWTIGSYSSGPTRKKKGYPYTSRRRKKRGSSTDERVELDRDKRSSETDSRSSSSSSYSPSPSRTKQGSSSPSQRMKDGKTYCFGCGRPDVFRRDCRRCSGNRKEGA